MMTILARNRPFANQRVVDGTLLADPVEEGAIGKIRALGATGNPTARSAN
jgi:hypothetical protein